MSPWCASWALIAIMRQFARFKKCFLSCLQYRWRWFYFASNLASSWSRNPSGHWFSFNVAMTGWVNQSHLLELYSTNLICGNDVDIQPGCYSFLSRFTFDLCWCHTWLHCYSEHHSLVNQFNYWEFDWHLIVFIMWYHSMEMLSFLGS